MKYAGIVTSCAFAWLVSVPTWAADLGSADLCAVSGVNGKFHLEGGAWDYESLDTQEIIQGVGSLSIPLGCAFGLQIDAGAGEFGEASAMGIGGHLFLRDPTSHLFGVHATYEDWTFDSPASDVTLWRIGAEAELYLNNVSLEAWAGLEDSNRTNADFFGKFTAAFYATENLRLAAGIRHANDLTWGALSTEWQLPDMPLSLTAEAEAGERDFRALTVGAKFYFGADQKPLIDRHRKDDPDDGLFDFIGGAANAAGVGSGTEPIDEGVTDDGFIPEPE